VQVADSKDGAEQLSVDRALRAIKRAEIVVAVIDGSEGITQQVGQSGQGKEVSLCCIWSKLMACAAT
jgi:predicted GTPase